MKLIRKIVLIAWGTIAFFGCKKSEVGFLSSNVFYRSNPFNAEQGVVTYSAPMEVDGSTAPLKVTLLDIRNKVTGKSVKDSLLMEREVTTFKAEITSSDTTLQMINDKLEKSMVKPFNINATGGRIELSSASRYIAAGTYEMDVQIQNIKGTRTILKACDIILKEPTTSYEFSYKSWSVSPIGAEVFSTPAELPYYKLNWDPTAENKIIMKWVDKNGTPFNPKAGEIIKRGDRPTFADWDPYYPEEKTDSTIIYKYPETGLEFPLLKSVAIAGGSIWNDGICYYRVKGTVIDINMNYNTVHTIKYLKSGTYELTFHLNGVVRK